MNTLVIYTSNYGNTQKVAETIAAEIGAQSRNVADISPSELTKFGFIVVGTPINGWKPAPAMEEFLSSLKKDQLKGVSATTFDTRVKLFIHGDAMGKVADALKEAGATITIDPKAFYVAGAQPTICLLDGELDKAKAWGREIQAKL